MWFCCKSSKLRQQASRSASPWGRQLHPSIFNCCYITPPRRFLFGYSLQGVGVCGPHAVGILLSGQVEDKSLAGFSGLVNTITSSGTPENRHHAVPCHIMPCALHTIRRFRAWVWASTVGEWRRWRTTLLPSSPPSCSGCPACSAGSMTREWLATVGVVYFKSPLKNISLQPSQQDSRLERAAGWTEMERSHVLW